MQKAIKGDRPVTWGLGIEQEAMPLYQHYYLHPVSNNSEHKYPVRDAVNITHGLRRRLSALMNDGRYPMDVALDYAGNERIVIELITRDYQSRQLSDIVQELIQTRKLFMDDFNFMVMPFDKNQTRAVWPLTGADYLVFKRKKDNVDIPRYLGSFHINITLPHPANITDREFQQMHIDAAMSLQWIEPLLLACYGCPSPASVLDGHTVTEMSVRHSEEPLAMALAKDLLKGFADDRKAIKIGHIADKQPKKARRRSMPDRRDIYKSDDPTYKIKHDRKRALELIKKEMTLQADQYPLWLQSIFRSAASSPLALRHFIRTRYGSVQYGLPMIGTDFRQDPDKGKRFGFEFRLMDYFPADYLLDVLRLMFYVMDASAQWSGGNECDAFLNSFVNRQYVAVILEGWNTVAIPQYQAALSFALGIPLNEQKQSIDCFDLLQELSVKLYKRFGQGRGIYSRFVDKDIDGKFFSTSPNILNINKASWEIFFQNGFPELAEYVRTLARQVQIDDVSKFLKEHKVTADDAQISEDIEEIQAYQARFQSDKSYR